MIVGSAIAGVAVRAKQGATLPAVGGVTLVHVIALLQTAVVVSVWRAGTAD